MKSIFPYFDDKELLKKSLRASPFLWSKEHANDKYKEYIESMDKDSIKPMFYWYRDLLKDYFFAVATHSGFSDDMITLREQMLYMTDLMREQTKNITDLKYNMIDSFREIRTQKRKIANK